MFLDNEKYGLDSKHYLNVDLPELETISSTGYSLWSQLQVTLESIGL